jgi:hypothetical protein
MRRLAPLAIPLVAIALAGCGGDDGLYGGGEETTATPTTAAMSDEQRIEIAIEGALASGDPKLACERFVTEHYLRTTYGDRTACVQGQAPGSAAKSVKISGIAVDGESAKAVAVPKGGPSSGDRLRVTLVREGDAWKVDALRSNAPVGP